MEKRKMHHLNIRITDLEHERLEALIGDTFGAKTQLMRKLLNNFLNATKALKEQSKCSAELAQKTRE